MSAPFVAEIRMFCCNFAPTGWALCNGQLLPISQNTALFSLLGTFYGGDGKSTFALPGLAGNVAMFWGQGSGLSDHFIGETSGTPQVTLLTSEIATHTHDQLGTSDPADLAAPAPNRSLARSQPFVYKQPASNPPTQPLAFEAVGLTGGGQPHNNMMPYLAVNFCIALQGVFPPRG